MLCNTNNAREAAFGFLEYPRMVTLERLLLDHDLWVFRLYAYLHDVRNGSTSAQWGYEAMTIYSINDER